MAWAEKQVGKLTYVSWRNKFTGWHDSWAMSIDGEKIGGKVNWHDSYNLLMRGKKGFLNSRLSQGDMFYRLFLSDSCLGKACYEKCKFKYDHSSADIRIGDLWGKTYKDNEDGVSAAIAFTEKGNELLHECGCNLVAHPFEVVAECQMKTNPPQPVYTAKVRVNLHDTSKPLSQAMKYPNKILRIKRWKGRLNHLFRIFKIKYQFR